MRGMMRLALLGVPGAQQGGGADTTAPTVEITSDAEATVYGAFSVTITFSEPVVGFTIDDISAGNATLSEFADSGDATVYTVTVTPTTEGAVTLDIAAGVCADAAGNLNEAATQFSRTHVEPLFETTTISITPTLGSELLTNGNMETGDPPTGWIYSNVTASAVADERTGGTGTQSLSMARNGSNSMIAFRDVATAAGDWVRFGGWDKRIDATDVNYTLYNSNPYTVYGFLGFYSAATWTEHLGVALFRGGNGRFAITARAFGADGTSYRVDDATVKTVSDWYDLHTHPLWHGEFSVNVTQSGLYPAGVIFGVQSATYYSVCYLGGDGKVHLVDRTGSSVTLIGSWDITYVADAKLAVTVHQDGTRDVVYNGTTLASGLASSGLVGLGAGPFLTDASKVTISRYAWDATST